MHNYSNMQNKQMVIYTCQILPFFIISLTHACKMTPFSWFREFAPSIEKIPPFSRKWVRAWSHIRFVREWGSRGYWSFVRGIHRSPVNSLHRPVTRSVDVFFDLNDWVNNREAGDLRRRRAHYDVIVMGMCFSCRDVDARGYAHRFNIGLEIE